MTSASSAATERAGTLRSRTRARLPAVPLIVAVYVVCAIGLTLPAWLAAVPTYVGAGGDPQQTMWWLAWTPFSIGHLQNPLLSDYMNYPDGFNLMWQTWIPAIGIVLWPVTAIWGPLVTWNVAMTAAPALGAVFAFFAVRRFVPSTVAAAAGALVYGFSPFVLAQMLGHAHMVLSVITPPLALLLLDELVIRRRMRPLTLALLIAGLGILQFFIAEEVFVTELIAAGVVVVVLGFMDRAQARPALAYGWRVLRVAVPIVAVVIAVPAAVQFLGPNHISGPPIHSPDIYLTDPFNLILPTEVQWLSPAPLQQLTTHFTGNSSEWDGYIGLPLLVTLLIALRVYWRVPLARAVGLAAIAITVLSLGPHLHGLGRNSGAPLPWWFFAHLPVVKNIQPNRLMIFVFLAVGIGLAFVLSRLTADGKRGVAALVAVVALVPLIPRLPLPATPLQQPAFFTTDDVNVIPSGAVVLTAPWAEVQHPSAYAWQFAAGFRYRQLGGYILGATSASSTALHTLLDLIASTHKPLIVEGHNREIALEELQQTAVNVILVGPSPDQQLYAAFFTHLLGSPPHVRNGVDLWFLTSLLRRDLVLEVRAEHEPRLRLERGDDAQRQPDDRIEEQLNVGPAAAPPVPLRGFR